MENKEFSTEVKNPKSPHKFNITDAVLILIIIIAAAVLLYIVLGTRLFLGGEEVAIQYTIEITPIKNEFVPAISKLMPGDKITDSIRGYDMGTIKKVQISEAYENVENRDMGIVQRTLRPNHSQVLITVEAKAQKDSKDINYLINGKIIMSGMQLYFRTQHFVNYGTCIDFTEVKGD